MYRINIRRSIPSRPSGSVSPAVLADDSSIISAILNRGGNKRIRSYFSSDRDKAFQNLTTHESHPTAGSSVPPLPMLLIPVPFIIVAPIVPAT